MKSEPQRIAIAEACGYTHVRIVKSLDGPPDHCIGHHPAQPHSIPDYLNDLNAIQQVVLGLPMGGCEPCQIRFTENLQGICWSWPETVNATAAQRAEAFLKTVGRWEESK
jgi:hypothetical protein